MIVATRKGMRSVKTCVKNGIIVLHVPEGIGYANLLKILDDNRVGLRQLLAKNEATRLRYHAGQSFKCLSGYNITIGTQHTLPGKVVFGNSETGNMYINLPQDADFDSERTTSLISRCLKMLAKRIAPQVLIPYAEEVATEVGAKPWRFVIGSGLHKLGHCTPKGEIQLSFNLMFLPDHLARFIILHELAHLTHFNHSPQFHALLNRYCNGEEKRLDTELKHFPWPVKL